MGGASSAATSSKMAASMAGGSCRAWGGCPGRRALALLWRGLCSGSRRPSDERDTHFGFQTVSEAEKAEKVYQVFENVAKKYDLMNDSMSLGIHRVWKDILLRQMNPYPGTQLLDVAGGTGDIAFRFLNYVRSQRERQVQQKLRSNQNLSWQEITKLYQEEEHRSLGGSHVVVCDINKEMLKVGKQKSQRLGYSEGAAKQSPHIPSQTPQKIQPSMASTKAAKRFSKTKRGRTSSGYRSLPHTQGDLRPSESLQGLGV